MSFLGSHTSLSGSCNFQMSRTKVNSVLSRPVSQDSLFSMHPEFKLILKFIAVEFYET